MDGPLWVTCRPRVAARLAHSTPLYYTYEEYRLDALGRRVLVRARKSCQNHPLADEVCPMLSSVRRTVWAGDRELYEIQMPDDDGENDTAEPPTQPRTDGFDPNPFWGRVAYTYGGAIDQPLSIVRVGYKDYHHAAGIQAWPEFAIIPHWNAHGQAQTGTFQDGTADHCRGGYTDWCVKLEWADGLFPYKPGPPVPEHWHGTLIGQKRDASGLMYRRNRYYDPATGRFTQEDPIGLAGGVNVYGLAAGDPVTYSDPYGLCPQYLTGRPCLSPLTGLGELRIRLRTDGSPRVGQFGMTRNGGTKAHQGLDILGSRGEIIRAVDDGVVVSVRMRGDGAAYGNDITIGHRNQAGDIVSYSFYAHLGWVNPNVKPGVEVAAGDYIASMGDSGNAKGTPMHLHFELRTQNPAGRGLAGRIDPEFHLPVVP